MRGRHRARDDRGRFSSQSRMQATVRRRRAAAIETVSSPGRVPPGRPEEISERQREKIKASNTKPDRGPKFAASEAGRRPIIDDDFPENLGGARNPTRRMSTKRRGPSVGPLLLTHFSRTPRMFSEISGERRLKNIERGASIHRRRVTIPAIFAGVPDAVFQFTFFPAMAAYRKTGMEHSPTVATISPSGTPPASIST